MIDKTITGLNLLIGAFVAGAIVCAVALVETWLGWKVTGADLPLLFVAVALLTAAPRLSAQVEAEAQRERVRLEGDKLRNQRVAVELENLTAPVAVAAEELEVTEPETMADWRVAAHRFLVAGDRHGFGVRVLYPMGFVTWDDWGIMLRFLSEAGILVRKPAAAWADGWNLDLWHEKCHSYPLPYRQEKPPTVALNPTTTTNNSAQQAPRVVEGLRAD